jgi:hypothetical protein
MSMASPGPMMVVKGFMKLAGAVVGDCSDRSLAWAV